jgi:hypothetical protein
MLGSHEVPKHSYQKGGCRDIIAIVYHHLRTKLTSSFEIAECIMIICRQPPPVDGATAAPPGN